MRKPRYSPLPPEFLQRPGNRQRRSVGLYKFGFWSTLICLILSVPLSIVSIKATQLIVSLWAWLNGPTAADITSLQYWIFGIETKASYVGQMLIENVISFMHDFLCYSSGLLFSFWCFINLRRHTRLKISIGSIVMLLCAGYILFGLMSLASDVFYSWKVYQSGTLQCDLFSFQFYKCNFVLLEIPRITASLSNLMAAVFAGEIYSRHLDDTDAWIEDMSRKLEEKMSIFGTD